LSKAHYWLLLKIAEKPKAFTYGAGILIALLLMLATAVTVVWVDESHIAERHDNALQARAPPRRKAPLFLTALQRTTTSAATTTIFCI